MEKTSIDVTLALGQSHVRRVVTVKRYDSHCTLRLRLTHGGSPYPVTEDCQGVFTALKPDGTVIYNPCTREGSVFLYDLTPQTTAVAGELPCELKLYGPEEALLTSASFLLSVADTVYSGDEELASTAEAEVLTQLVNQAGDKLSKMDSVLKQAGNLVRIDNTVAGKYAWSGKHIADTLCPGFTQQGGLVTCKPLMGYPLEVISDFTGSTENLGKVYLYRGGKNLSPNVSAQETYTGGSVALKNNIITLNSDGSSSTNIAIGYSEQRTFVLPAGTYRLTIEKTGGTAAALSELYFGLRDSASSWAVETGVYSVNGSAAKTFTFTQPKRVCVCCIGNAKQGFDNLTYRVQLEKGNVSTDYEPYRGTLLAVDMAGLVTDGEGRYHWDTGVLEVFGAGWLYQLDPETGIFTQVGETGDIEAGIYTPDSLEVLPALSGENVVYAVTEAADVACTTTVSGRLDPLPLLEKLQNL